MDAFKQSSSVHTCPLSFCAVFSKMVITPSSDVQMMCHLLGWNLGFKTLPASSRGPLELSRVKSYGRLFRRVWTDGSKWTIMDPCSGDPWFKLIMTCRFWLVRTGSFLLVASFPSVVAPSSSHIYLRTTNVAHLGSITFSYVFKLILARKACTSCWSFLA
jgi:hypothetical protein